MEARELRIGNYFSTGQNDNIAKVTPNIIEALCESENRSWINPIPLTEEWLLKFGFQEICEKGSFEINRESFSLTYSEGKMWFCFGQFAEQSNTVPCKHVHQLQNLYFALTGEELEITKTK
jgi:hypothetical protein